MPKCYQYDHEGYFSFEIEDDCGFLPAGAVYHAPEFKDGHIPRWNGKTWEQVETHKGKEGYVNGQPYTIKKHGPLPEGWSETPPPPTVEEAKAAKWAEIVNGQAMIMAQVKQAYPDDEREGWPFKLPEAEAILAGLDTPTPYIDAEFLGSAGLYENKMQLAAKVVDNNAAFRAFSGFINGQQTAMYHALEKLAAQTGMSDDEHADDGTLAEKIKAMPVNYILPEGM